MKLLKQVKKLPNKPGVYAFLDKKNKPLYIGRATFLKRRVLNYFHPSTHSTDAQGGELSRATNSGQDSRLAEMKDSAVKIKHFKTDNLLEAIILEANLIKKYWPKYNIREKDNRSFVYVLISKKDDFPRPITVRGHEIENWKPRSSSLRGRLKIENFHIFGPYQSLSLIKNALRIIRRIFPCSMTCKPVNPQLVNSHGRIRIARVPSNDGASERYSHANIRMGAFAFREPRVCRGASERYSHACFDYQIGLCPGACIGKITKEDYQKNIDNIILLLQGEKKRLFKKLKKENPMAVQSLKHIQDVSLIKDENFQFSIRHLADNFQKINRIEGYDISHLSGKEAAGAMAAFADGKADKTQYRLFNIKQAPMNDDLRALEEVITRRFNHPEWPMPDLILIDGGRPQINFIFKVLEKMNIAIPLVGISKFGGDKLVFPAKMKSSLKELIESRKNLLLKVREEAHRFAIKSSRRRRTLT